MGNAENRFSQDVAHMLELTIRNLALAIVKETHTIFYCEIS